MHFRFMLSTTTALAAAIYVAGCGGTSTGSGNTAGAGGSGGAAGSGTTGGSAGTSGNAGTSGSAGSGGQAGSAGAGGACTKDCGKARACCDGACTNPANDPQHCGDCDTACGPGTYCSGGKCVEPPCTATCANAQQCCGETCCGADQLCCDPQGPLDRGPVCTTPNAQGTCPQGCAPLCVCASPDTPIATPQGDVPIAQLRPGDLVYSVDHAAVQVVPIARVHRTAVRGHHVQRVELQNGVVLRISEGHPTADGRFFAELHAGGELDGVAITSVESVPYEHEYTYDILPASDTGDYFAAGVRIGSTLKSLDLTPR